MTDWADVLARYICRHLPGAHPDAWKYLAPHLRKAKADGVREAAELVAHYHTSGPRNFFTDELRIRAAAVERGDDTPAGET